MVKSALFIGCGDIATRAALMLQPQSIEAPVDLAKKIIEPHI